LLFQNVLGESIAANLLTLGIQPEEKINLTFETKNPGAKVCLRSVTMDFNYQENYEGPVLDAYEKALIDCMQGDQMLFWRWAASNCAGLSWTRSWSTAKVARTDPAACYRMKREAGGRMPRKFASPGNDVALLITERGFK
jgi:glucose-6-phosphate 1-dehydrogenase